MTATVTRETFDPAMISGFPEPAHRWLRHAIAPGTPLGGSVELTMHGRIKLGRWRLFPVLTAAGPDITAVATWQFGDDTESAGLQIARSGRAAEIRVNRWGDPGGEPFGRYPFGVRVEAERRFGGVTIPSVFRAGWWWGTERQHEGEFFRAEITGAVFS